MDSSDCSNNSESINSPESRNLIELRKTTDIKLVKGWRNKQFKVSSTKDLSECKNYTLLCDDLKNYDNDDLLTEDNNLINLDSLRVILSNDHYKKIGEKIKSSYNSDFMQNLTNKIDKDELTAEKIEDKSSELDCKIDKNSKNCKLSSLVNKNEKFLSHSPLSQKKCSKVENTSGKLDSKSESSVSDDETSISYLSRTSRSSLNLDQDQDHFIKKPRTVFEKRLLYETESRNKNSSELMSSDELRRDFQYIDKYKKYDNNFRMKDAKNVLNDPCIDDKVLVNKNEKPTSHMVFNGNSYKVTRQNKLKDMASNKKTSVVSRRISKKMLKREKLKSASRRLKRLSKNPYLTPFHGRLDEKTTALLEKYTSITKGNKTDYKDDKRKPVMVIHLGIGRCLFKEQVTNLSLLRKQDHVISEKWAKYSVSTVVDKHCKNELTKFMVPVVFPLLIQLMEKSDKLRLGLSSTNSGDKVINDNLFSVDKNENLSVKINESNKYINDNLPAVDKNENLSVKSNEGNKCINDNLPAVDKKENLSVSNEKMNKSINDSTPSVDKNINLNVNNNESNTFKEDDRAKLALSEKCKLDSDSVKPKDKLSTSISDKTISLPNVKNKIRRKLQHTDKVHHEESERKLIGMYDTSSIRNILSEMSAQTEASDKNCKKEIKEGSIDKSKRNFKGIDNNKKKINSTKTDTSLLSDNSKDSPADPSVKTDKLADSDAGSQISQTDSDVSETSPTKNLHFSNRVVDKNTGRVKYTGKQRRVALELKRLNSDFLEIDDSSKENSGENLNDSRNPDDMSSSISSDNLKSVLPDDIVKRLAKFEKDYHQTVMKSKDKMIFVSKYSERNKRTKKLPKKLEDTVWLGKDVDFFENVMKHEGVGSNDLIGGKKKHDNYDEKVLDSIKNCNKLNDSDAELNRKNILQKDPIIKEKGLSSIATDKRAVRGSDLIQIKGGKKLGKSEDVHHAALEENKKLYFGGKISIKEESTDSKKSFVNAASENGIKIPCEVQPVDVKQSNKIQMEGKVISRRRNHNFRNNNGVIQTNISGNQKDLVRLRKMNGFLLKKSVNSNSCNESDKLLKIGMKSTSEVEDNDEKELNELKSRILKYNEHNLRPIETQSMTEVLENRLSDIIDPKLSSKICFRENSVLVQTAKSILKPVHLRAGNINDFIGLCDNESRKGILPEKYLIVKVEKIKIPNRVPVWCMDHNQYYCSCLKYLEKSKNVAKKRIHPLFSSELKSSKQPTLSTLISKSNDRHDSLKFLKGYSGSAFETDYTKTNNTNVDQNVLVGQKNFTFGCLNNGKRNDDSMLINKNNQIHLGEVNVCRNSERVEKMDCWNNSNSCDDSSSIDETNQVCGNKFSIVDTVVPVEKKIVQENDTDCKIDLIIEEREDQPALIPRIESVMSLDPKEFYNDDICSEVHVSNTATTQSDESNDCPSEIQENAKEAIVSPSITDPKLKETVQNFTLKHPINSKLLKHPKNSVSLKENGIPNCWYRFFCIYVRKTKFSYLQFRGGPSNNVKIPYEGITDLLVEAIKEQKCFHRPLKKLGVKGFSEYHDLSFGIYAVPNECVVYFGPYGQDEPHMLQAFDVSIKPTKNSVSEESGESVSSRLLPFVAPAFESEFTIPYVLGSWWDFKNCKASQENIFSLLKTASKFNSDSFPALSSMSVLKCSELNQLSQSANEKNQSTGSNKIKLLSLQHKSLLISNRRNLNVSENKANKQSEPHNNNKFVSLSSLCMNKNTKEIPEKFKPPCTLKSIVKNTAAINSLNSQSSRNNFAGEFKPLSPPFTVRSSAGNTIAETSTSSLVTDNSRANNPYKLNILASYSGLSSSAVKANEGKSTSNDGCVNNVDSTFLREAPLAASTDNSNVNTSVRPSSLFCDDQLEEETNDSNIESSDSKFVNAPNVKATALSSSSTSTSISKADPIVLCRQKKNMPILVNVLPDGDIVPVIPLQKVDQNGKKFYYYNNKIIDLDLGIDNQLKSIYGKNVSADDKSNKKAAPNSDVSPNSVHKSNGNVAVNTSDANCILTAENLNSNNICNKAKELPNGKIVSGLSVRESGKKFKTNFVTFYPPSEAIPDFKRSKIATEQTNVKRLPTDLGNKSGSIVSINADNGVCMTNSKFSKLMQEWEHCRNNAKQLSITKLSSAGLSKKSNSIRSIDYDDSTADSTEGKSFLESKPSNITSKQSFLKPLSTKIGYNAKSSNENVADAINSVVHKFTTEPKLCKITTKLPLSKVLSVDSSTKSDLVVFLSDGHVISSNSSACELPYQSKRSNCIATEQSSLSKLLPPGLLDRSDTVALASNDSGVSLVPITSITKQASVSNNNIAHQEKSDVRVTLSSAVNNSSTLPTKASQECEGKSEISENLNGDPMIHIDDDHPPVPFMELAPLESATSTNSKTTENLVHSDAEQPHNIKLLTQTLERELKYEQYLLRPGEKPPPEIPKTVFLCSIPKIGYVTLVHNVPDSVLLEDPRDSEQVLKFSNLKDASTWLNEFLRMNLVFEENVKSPNWDIVEHYDIIKKLRPFNINRFKKYTLVSGNGVYQFDHIDIYDPYQKIDELDEISAKKWICKILGKRKKYKDLDWDSKNLSDKIVDEIRFLEVQERKHKVEKEKLLLCYNELFGRRRKLFAEKGVYFTAEGRIYVRCSTKENNDISSGEESEHPKNPTVGMIKSFKRENNDSDDSLKTDKVVNSLEILEVNEEINPKVKSTANSDEISAVQSENSSEVRVTNNLSNNVPLFSDNKLNECNKVDKEGKNMDSVFEIERKNLLTKNRVSAIKEKYRQIRKVKEALSMSSMKKRSNLLGRLKSTEMKTNEEKSVIINIGENICCSNVSPKWNEKTSVNKGQKLKKIDIKSSEAPAENNDMSIVDDLQLKLKSNKERKKDNVLLVKCKRKMSSTPNEIQKVKNTVERSEKINTVCTETPPLSSKNRCDSPNNNKDSLFKTRCQKLKTSDSKGNLLHIIKFNTSNDILRSIGSERDSHQLKVSKAGFPKIPSKHSNMLNSHFNFSKNNPKVCYKKRKTFFKRNKIQRKVSFLNRHNVINRDLNEPRPPKKVKNHFHVSSSALNIVHDSILGNDQSQSKIITNRENLIFSKNSRYCDDYNSFNDDVVRHHEVSISRNNDDLVSSDEISEGNLLEDNRILMEKFYRKNSLVKIGGSNAMMKNNVMSLGVNSSDDLDSIDSGVVCIPNDGSPLIPADSNDSALRQKPILQVSKLNVLNDQSDSDTASVNLTAKSRKFLLTEPKLKLPIEVNDYQFYTNTSELSLSSSSMIISGSNEGSNEHWESFFNFNNDMDDITLPDSFTADCTNNGVLYDVPSSGNLNDDILEPNDNKISFHTHPGGDILDNKLTENRFTGYRSNNFDDDDFKMLNDDPVPNHNVSKLLSNIKDDCDDENQSVDVKTDFGCVNNVATLDTIRTCSEKYYIGDDGDCLVVVSDSDDDNDDYNQTFNSDNNMLSRENLGDMCNNNHSLVDTGSTAKRQKTNIRNTYSLFLDNGMAIDITPDDLQRLHNKRKNSFSSNKGADIIHKNKLDIKESFYEDGA